MSGGLSLCQNENRQVLGIVVEKREQYDYGFDETIAYLQQYDLLRKDIYFASWVELGKFLRDKQERFKRGFEVLNNKQIMVLDQALYDTLGRRLYS